ncbi:hypothetical protein CN518_24535 [Bacillus anthracis]|nr:hypothetical protein CN518_24535 [Bacillus anthracis]
MRSSGKVQLQSLHIDKFKLIEKSDVIFVPEGGYPEYYYHYFDKNNFTILVGENGNGKTTLMSFIVNVFHNLQRFHNRIYSDFCLKYRIHKKMVTLEKESENVYITVEGCVPKSLLIEFDPKRGYVLKKNKRNFENKVTYDEIKMYLPTNVITSVFSMHGEYPMERPSHFIGERIVHRYNISDIYGINHFNFSSLSKGIRRFLEMYSKNGKIIDDLLELLNLRFCKEVVVRLRERPKWGYESEDEAKKHKKRISLVESFVNSNMVEEDNGKILKLNENTYRELIEYEEEKLLYLNDIFFEKNGSIVCLDNMSSGEKMFFIRVFSLLASIENNSLIIIEEPELHLNPSWTKQIITMLQMLFSSYQAHFVISTHSYSFINTVFPENIIFARDKQFINLDSNVNTFLANEVEINNIFFANSKKLNYVEDKLWKRIQNRDIDEIENILGYLGESYTKFQLFNIWMEKRGVSEDVES